MRGLAPALSARIVAALGQARAAPPDPRHAGVLHSAIHSAVHVSTRTHACARANSHTRTRAISYTHTHALSRPLTDAHAHSHIHTRSHAERGRERYRHTKRERERYTHTRTQGTRTHCVYKNQLSQKYQAPIASQTAARSLLALEIVIRTERCS